MKSTESIRVELDDGLAILSLAQPARGNPIDGPFGRDFKQVASDLLDAPGLRAVLLRADGPNFSFGGDLKTFYPARDRLAPLVREWTAELHMGLQRFWRLPVPVVTAVQGFAMGGGVAMLAGCDVVMAGASARLGSAFAQLGFSCDSGSTVTLTYRMGVARARRFVLLAEMLDSQGAQAAGLVDLVVPDAQLQDDALALARRFAAGPTVAYGETKRLFMKAGAAQLEAQLEDEALTLARVSATLDAQEGIAAHVEKRKPVFQGR
ncbi:enoyl-CoA hydratase-related protein [Variovorax sp. dw_954]|uniref:enoyl-CoA hydratase/isomerase family protein n=1 Tax=Variovorax sp. dw_954 TaxID=2720078 RepID=UPI001BD4B406|nr:enoyl-CoA hydratase-related protein [Variovorax sp. dw_954]